MNTIIRHIPNTYFIGFILSVILTIIPFCAVKYCNFINKSIPLLIITICAFIQIYIHLVLFIHLNNTSNKIWNLISLIFTMFIIFILILGSIWIMTHLHHNLII